jgi:hypothetical protein
MEKKLTIELDIPKWNVVMRGVTQLPYGEVAQLIAEIQAQADAQLATSPVQEQAAEVQPS